ncbi:hypothetical protein M0722_01590 [Microbacterium sp. KSW4-16]|uniref:hypothetical protein n=1 Tax=Microbacterium aurugineum TaxID=2851642 RepID=UPI0020BFC47F|nr:hypothetical protein [Microbacterium aurugineum]MCK8465875.1 hypothetical protein [Microbacterium aurugineum]
MSPLDIIPIPGHPGMHARRIAVEAWRTAGSPPINSAGRLYGAQKYFWDGWAQRLPGFNPADNPDDESQRLAHVRFVAFDIDPTPERIRRLGAAGMIRPYAYEPWHWELPNVRSYAIVRSLPSTAGGTTTPTQRRDPMGMQIARNKDDSSAEGARFLWGDGKAPEVISASTAEIFKDAGVPESPMQRKRWLWLLEWARERARTNP